jgi:opacity protein-like surface antigen
VSSGRRGQPNDCSGVDVAVARGTGSASGMSEDTEVHVNKTIATSAIMALLGLGVSALVSSPAMAANGYGYDNGAIDSSGFYIGANAGEIFYKEQGIPALAPGVAFLNVGEQFNPYVALEGRVGGGFVGDNFRYFHVDIPLVYGGYVKGMLPVSPWFSAYAIAGVGGVQVHRNYPDFNSNNVGFSAGAGAEFTLYGGARVHAEWARLDSGTNDGYSYTVDQLSVGVSWLL